MTDPSFMTALIVGAGNGLSASLARLLADEGLQVALAARDVQKLEPLAAEINGAAFAADASDPAQVAKLFDEVTERIGEPDVVIYNASGRLRGPFVDLDPAAVAQALAVSAYG